MASIGLYDGGRSARGSNWIGVLILGIMFLFSGILGSIMFSAMSHDDDPFAPATFESFDRAASAMTAGMALLGFVFILLSFYVKRHEEQKAERERAAEEARSEAFAQRVASQNDGIKVRCRYCGALNDEHDEKCESCGAPL